MPDELNDAQRRAVTHDGGPLLIVAGAGTGKTTTLACRVAHLIATGVAPARILLLTFTRRAAQEMLGRAGRLTEPAAASQVWGGTFHGVANRLLRRYGAPLGLAPSFTVLDQADAADLLDLIRSELDLGSDRKRFPRKATLADIYSRTVNTQRALQDVLERDFPWCAEQADGIRDIFHAYTRRKRRLQLLDFDDLLLYWLAAGQSARVGEIIAGLFDHVLVDEYQDTNTLQADILTALHRPGAGLTAVGDDAQAIYSFRSATVRNILDFPARFPGTTVVTLEQNYRSTEPILGLTNRVIARAAQRYPKDLRSSRPGRRMPELLTCTDEAAQSDAVCTQVLEHLESGTLLRQQAVLFRTGHHSDALEVELARRNIPFVKYGGLRFLEAAHVKDLMALLRVADNPHDEVGWFRVLQLVEGVGPATARRLMSESGVGDPAAESPLATLAASGLAAHGSADLGRLCGALHDCVTSQLSVPSQIERLRAFLDPVVERVYDHASSRRQDLERLEQMAAGFPTRTRFVSELTLDPPASTGDLAGSPLLDEDYLILSTIHSAKGCEWDVVHVIHAADGMIPSDMATGTEDGIEEERRLLYVAMTRARDMLHVYFPMRYYHRPRGLDDQHGYAQLTRFLPSAVRLAFEERVWGTAPEPVEPGWTPAADAAVDRFLSKLW